MFERFTNPARHVVVLAQEEARLLRHNYIGTEHVLLGLLAERDGLAARALDRFGMSLAAAREEVGARIPPGTEPMTGHIPFTPRAKKTLELALREALELHHDHIGTEHLLLGMVREADGVGPHIVAAHAGDLMAVRSAVLDLLPAAQTTQERRWLRRYSTAVGEEGEELRTTPAADASLGQAAHLAGTGPVGSHHLLLATLADPDTAAARALAALGVDLDQARQALSRADVTGSSDEQPEERGRRHMLIHVTDSGVTIDVTDETIAGLGRAAVEALGDQAGQPGQPGTIRGDLPVSASLGRVWQALRDSLEDIRRRAAAAEDTGAGPASQQAAGDA
jgi:ATP-dependent Clp protease ATP-binding subunit ClpC